MLSMHIVTVYPWILSIANEDFDSLVNIREPGEKPLCRKTNSQSFELQRNLRKCVFPHLSSQQLPCSNLFELKFCLTRFDFKVFTFQILQDTYLKF